MLKLEKNLDLVNHYLNNQTLFSFFFLNHIQDKNLREKPLSRNVGEVCEGSVCLVLFREEVGGQQKHRLILSHEKKKSCLITTNTSSSQIHCDSVYLERQSAVS